MLAELPEIRFPFAVGTKAVEEMLASEAEAIQPRYILDWTREGSSRMSLDRGNCR
jgi:hypothetical protein